MITSNDLFQAGKILKTHGVKGELIFAFQSTSFLDTDCFCVLIDGLYIPFFIESRRPKSDTTELVKIEGVDSESTALEFCDKEFYLPVALREADSSYTYDYFVGFSVMVDGVSVGKITSVNDMTDNVLFVLETPDGEVFIPAVEEYILDIRHDERVIEMQVPEGLLDLN